jgi:hypothetical protein
LITVKLTKIEIYASFTIKNAMVCNFSIIFVFFTNNFVNASKKGHKNCKKTENFSRKLVCHFTEKRYMRLFLGIEFKIDKKYWFWPNQNFVTHLTQDTPLKIGHFKNDFKKTP